MKIVLKKGLAFGLALVTVLPLLIACGDGADAETTAETTAVTTAADTLPTETERGQIRDDLPDTLDFEGRTIRILHRDDGADLAIEVDCEATGDVVNQAVYERNLAVKERLNVDIETIPVTATIHQGTPGRDAIRKSVTAGSDDYDLSYSMMSGTMGLSLENMLVDVYSIDYLNFDRPWWEESFMETATMYDKCYAAVGDMSLTLIQSMYLIFVNKTLYSDYFEGDIYDVVTDGQWTLDKLAEMGRTVYEDVNGNSTYDVSDQYGYSTTALRLIDAILFGADIKLTERDADGLPYFTIEGNERIITLVEKAASIISDNTLTWRVENSGQGEIDMLAKFAEGSLLFVPYTAMGASSLRDMENDFGVIPIPKLDDSQDEYTSSTHDGFSAVVVPATCTDTDAVGAFMEAMCAESYRYVTPAYYETALKIKYGRDDATSQMLDLIRDSIIFDFATIYNGDLNNAMTQFRDIINGSSTAASSIIATRMKTSNTMLEKLLDKFAELQ